MESKEQIKKHMNQYRANDVKMLYDLMAEVILGNNDFRLARYADSDDICPVIEDETGEKIDFSMESIIGKDQLAIWERIERYDTTDKIIKKAEQVELIASVLGDDTFFEGFCLAFYGTDENLARLCEDYGCTERYKELVNDPVYRKRKKYTQLISAYAKAAVNLYGVIHLVEFEDILIEYENALTNFDGHNRQVGTYKNSIIFNPRYLGLCSLQHLIGEAAPAILTTMDGILLHPCFLNDYLKERDDMVNFFAAKKGKITENDFEEFFVSVSEEISYRILQMEIMEKPFYLPSKKEFLRYADENYFETTSAEKEFRQYIEKVFRSNFACAAKKVGVSTDECIDDFLNELHKQATDVGKCGEERDPHEVVQFIFDAMQGYDIAFDDIEQANEFVGYAMQVMNSVRLWINHGNTPDELRRQMPANQNGVTIVPGSSQMAETLSEGREQLEQMGMHLDLDSTATDIPTLAFTNGIHGKSQKGVRKVYPNDSCPCGSGKKFKRCCGRH